MCARIFPSVFSAAVTPSISPTCVRRWKGTEQMGIRLKRWDAPNYLMSKGIGLICRFSTLVRLSGGNRLRSHRGSIYPDLLLKCLQYWKSEVRSKMIHCVRSAACYKPWNSYNKTTIFSISYKILLLAYKALNGKALTNLLSRYNPTLWTLGTG